MEIPVYPSRPAQSYTHHKTKDGLTVAIHKLTDKKEMREYFGVNMDSAKILAVFVKAENNNPDSSFLILKDKVKVGQTKTVVGREIASESAGNAVATIGAVALVIIPVAALPVLFSGMKMVSNASAIKHNFAVKELQTRTISPGKSVEGFIYFQIPDDLDKSMEWAVNVEAMKLKTKEEVSFYFPIDIKGEE